MYRVGLEAILGLKKRGDTLFVEPRAPRAWPEYSIDYRHGKSVYSIVVRTTSDAEESAVEVKIDGRLSSDGSIRLVDDGSRHEVAVRR
jgi:cellobiose phosphorylase